MASYSTRLLGPDDIPLLNGILTIFGDAFSEQETYGRARPGAAYLRRLFGGEWFIALVQETECGPGCPALRHSGAVASADVERIAF